MRANEGPMKTARDPSRYGKSRHWSLLVSFWCAARLLAGCSIDQRQLDGANTPPFMPFGSAGSGGMDNMAGVVAKPEPSSSGGSSGEAPPPVTLQALANGAACISADRCQSSHCEATATDGVSVCCASDCGP